MKRLLFLLLAVICFSTNPFARNNSADSIPVNSRDVESVDAIVAALYNVISGPAGEKRNWDRMRTLFIVESRMIATGVRKDGTGVKRAMSIEDYIGSSGPFLEKDGFFEKEISRKSEQFGNIVHLFSTYESRKKVDDEKPFMRGINSIQLWNDGKRWWIVNVFWQAESADNPLPEKYLH